MKATSTLRTLVLGVAAIATLSLTAETTTPVPSEVIHVTPAAGAVTSLSTWNISFDCEWGLADRSAKFAVTAPEGVEVPKLKSKSTGTGYIVYLEDDMELTSPGTYTFTIPEGKFSVGAEGASATNPALTYEYTIADDGGTAFPSYEITPAPGTYTSIDNGFTIVFDAPELILVNASGIVLYGPEGTVSSTAEVVEGSPILTVTSLDTKGEATALTQYGYYTLQISAGAVQVQGLSNGKAIEFHYLLEEENAGVWSGTISASPSAAGPVESLKAIDITFRGATKVAVSDYCGPSDFPTLCDAATGDKITGASVFASTNVLQLSLYEEISTPGTYILTVPKGLLRVDKMSLAEDIVITYVIKDKETTIVLTPSLADGENSAAAVFTTDGRIVTIGTGDNLRSLPAGVYIVNGKKMIVK